MKYVLFIISILGILAQSITKSVIAVSYELNKEYISKNLCEKRSSRNNKCKGACHLKLKLRQSEERHPGELPLLKEKYETVLYCSFLPVKFQSQEQVDNLLPTSVYSFPRPLSLSIFHPPRA